MRSAVRRISIPAESELAEGLRAAKEAADSIELDTGDTIYEVFIGRTQPATLDAESVTRSIAGIRAAAGSWREAVDVEAFRAYLAERPRIRTRPQVTL